MSASEKTTKELSESDALETDPEVRLSSQLDEGDASTDTGVVTKETLPMGGMLSQSQLHEIQRDGSKNGEESEQPSTTSSSVSGRTLTGHAPKTLLSTSSSSLSSSTSTSSPSGRAKMSVFGPGSKALLPPPSSSSPPPVPGQTVKIHRARKTMNRPPPTQMRCIESAIVLVNPTDPTTSFATDSDTAAAKRRRLVQGFDGTPEKAESAIGTEQKADRVLREAARRRDSWLEDAEEDEFLLYNPYARDDTDAAYSDSKSEDGGLEERLHERDAEESGNMSDHSSELDPQRQGQRNEGSSDSPWTRPGRGKGRERAEGVEAGRAVSAAATLGGSREYTEVALGSLDIVATDNLTLSPQNEGSDAGETERLEELPLCSCRMEAPRVDSASRRPNRLCMATESVNGELVGCTNIIQKGETMRPSSRVSLIVLCESHRLHMVKHHCCPGCGYFCVAGTFLECCPDQRIAHRFHRGCVTVLGAGRGRGMGTGMLFCPHCGEDASEAQEVTIPPSASAATVVTTNASSTTTLSLPPPIPSALSLAASMGPLKNGKRPVGPISARMRGVVKRDPDQQAPLATLAAGPVNTAPPGEGAVDSVGPSLCLPNGKPVCPSALPPGPSRAALQKAILIQDTERRKKLRFHPRQLYPAAKQGEVQRVLLMLMEGIDPAYQADSQNRRCALHVAAQRGLLEVCYMLVQAGAKLDVQDQSMRTPLLEAIVNNHVEVTRYLVQSGACVYHTEEDGYTGLHHAAKLGSLDIVTLLLETGQVDINAQDSGGWTPIIWAAEHKHIKVIRALLNRGADVTLKDKEMNACLHWASFAGCVGIAEMVLNAGCPLSSVNMHGDTPLHIASREGFLECVTLFLSRGADIDIMNREGDTPLSLARSDSPVWVSLQINRKLRRGIANRMVHTEKIISSDVAQGYENVPIPCVNAVDDEGCPSDYKYVSENCETSAMNIDRNITHLQHCSCTDDCSSSNCLCGQLSIRCWYDKDHRLLQEFNKIEPPLIFECNLGCSCFRTCKNRVVQAGIKVRLQLYRTEKMGWGVRALQDIPQGSFICEYVGELISDAEADVREDDSYLFDLDNKDGEVYCIDARYYGNISRFINHLCDPNIIPVRVFMLHQDLRFPRIAFFSSRDILTGQELGFDYGDRFWDIKSKYFTCQCGSEKCKHSAEAIALEQSRLARLETCPESETDPGLAMLGNF
ncbi:histone-lysine N-methyltransferase EHMT2 isoform X1 [Coregonus clupeaformis]|uniref:histone-lysine N-methyltransferase EHMT2 isoform X1 n=1 Tax=Coregonus clupeaformis TaxID=59861 RepID=UPI001E1C5E9D|nr:histone-lysine N-methyltransferase EHMT2 isoform X1 [Coregonus clupeaformis]